MQLSIESIKQIDNKDKVCCNKQMYEFEHSMNGKDTLIYVCLECGWAISVIIEQLDEEDLENYKEMAEQLDANPSLTEFKVSKKGKGLNTDYTVIPIFPKEEQIM